MIWKTCSKRAEKEGLSGWHIKLAIAGHTLARATLSTFPSGKVLMPFDALNVRKSAITALRNAKRTRHGHITAETVASIYVSF